MAVKKAKKKPGKVANKSSVQLGNSHGSRVSGGKIIITTLSIGALGVIGYLGWQYIRTRRAKRGANLDETLLQNSAGDSNITYPPGISLDPLPGNTGSSVPSGIKFPSGVTSSGTNNATVKSADNFPLRKGSKGESVRRMQLSIIKKYGTAMLPKYGADGDFGTETVNALKKLKMPITISETYFNVLTQGIDSSENNAVSLSGLATKIYNATVKKDFNAVIVLLKSIKSSTDYNTVSEAFKQHRLAGVRKTLVTGLLDTFQTAAQKDQLRLAFATMGLTYDGEKWSLSGIDGIPILTTVPARIWVNASTAVNVPAHMILGNEVARRLQYVLFVNNGRHFLVHSNCVKHLKTNQI